MTTITDQDIEAFLDNELSSHRTEQIRQHILENSAAQQRYNDLELQKQMLLEWFLATHKTH